MKPKINIFWFKRDLRLYDNEALNAILKSDFPILLIYIFEPSLYCDEHYSLRHWRFVYQSLLDLNIELKKIETEIHIAYSEVESVYKRIQEKFQIQSVYSTQETGLEITYNRDREFSAFCKSNNILWKEFQNGGAIRGLKNRDTWRKQWYSYMSKPVRNQILKHTDFIDFKLPNTISLPLSTVKTFDKNNVFQYGGRSEGVKWVESFFNERLQYYSDYISKPELSRIGCSRLSPYFAWGCLSIREVYQRCVVLKTASKYKRQLSAFMSRLRWQAHFIQKFEMEPRIEFEAFNKGYLDLEQPLNKNYLRAWKTGTTGFPLVDASLRAVAETGYLNFRMRTMCTSFLVHLMFQHFTTGSAWLARQFLDFEPGIHYAQFQMQAGFTATNTLRIYNPTKNAKDHDPDAVFIKKWVPELSDLPTDLAIEPWNISDMEQNLYGFDYGNDYPKRILDYSEKRKFALQELYGKRKENLTKKEKQRILKVHTLKRNYLKK